MKLKISHIYMIFAAAAVITLFIFIISSGNNDDKKVSSSGNIGNKQMPSDEIHKGTNNPTIPPPSKDNVSESFKHEMDVLQNKFNENPNDTSVIKQYADLLAASHKQDDAVPLYEKILKKNPRRSDILFSLSFIYYNKRDLDNAKLTTKKILSFDKNNLQALYNLGAIAASKGDSQKAKEIWLNLITKYPGSGIAGLAKESLDKLK